MERVPLEQREREGLPPAESNLRQFQREVRSGAAALKNLKCLVGADV